MQALAQITAKKEQETAPKDNDVILKQEGLVLVYNSQKGKSVIAGKEFKKGEMILTSPVISFPDIIDVVGLASMKTYVYFWRSDKSDLAITCSISTYINHWSDPNAVVERDFERNLEYLIARKNIKKGEEITVDYVELEYGDPVDFSEAGPLFIELD
jgi:SET domain-containing protein